MAGVRIAKQTTVATAIAVCGRSENHRILSLSGRFGGSPDKTAGACRKP
jgi:hypothetical protein